MAGAAIRSRLLDTQQGGGKSEPCLERRRAPDVPVGLTSFGLLIGTRAGRLDKPDMLNNVRSAIATRWRIVRPRRASPPSGFLASGSTAGEHLRARTRRVLVMVEV